MRTSGTRLERRLFRAGRSEKPDANLIREAAQAIHFLPKALPAAALFVFVVRNLRRVSVALYYTMLPSAVVAIAVGAVYHSRAARRLPFRSVPSAVVSSQICPAPAAAAIPPPLLEEAPGAQSNSVDTAPQTRRPAPTPSKGRNVVLTPPSARSAHDLNEEAQVLGRARVLLEAGRGSEALAAIDDYDRGFPKGAMCEEAIVLRIEGLAQRGDLSAARDLARRFLATYPASVHVRWVTSFLASYRT